MERVIRKDLVNHLELYKKFNPSQHGFRHRRSCLSQLLEHYDKILSFLEDGANVDFSKAFDKVDIGLLCHKLRDMGISGKLGIFLNNFLSNRKQYILANGSKSGQSEVKSGVPQGTVLGPVLFLILINDITDNIESDVSLFADDTRILRPVKNHDDVELLQQDLDKLYTWQDKNNMAFNGKKFEILRYGKDQELKNSTEYLTPDAEDLIQRKECLRDLGIQMSEDGKFSNHIDSVSSRVRQKCGWILRTFNCRNTYFMKFMWKSLVQGHIDYCSQLYFPSNHSSGLQSLENLFKVFSKKIPEVSHLDYWSRLKYLKMYSQERRAERYKIIYTWKVLEEMVPNCGISHTTSERRGRECTLPAPKGRTAIQSLRGQSFQKAGPALFNSLPRSLRDIKNKSTEEFKEKLDKFLTNLTDQPVIGELIPEICNQITARPSNSLKDVILHQKRMYGGG